MYKIVVENAMFEYGVILKGSQTCKATSQPRGTFEYGVILKGSQTARTFTRNNIMFEYGVILKGSQTLLPLLPIP